MVERWEPVELGLVFRCEAVYLWGWERYGYWERLGNVLLAEGLLNTGTVCIWGFHAVDR